MFFWFYAPLEPKWGTVRRGRPQAFPSKNEPFVTVVPDNPTDFLSRAGFFQAEPVRDPWCRKSKPMFSRTPTMHYAKDPCPHYATVPSILFPSLPEAILVLDCIQRGAHEHHPLDDSRLSVGDRRHCHAPLDQAVDRKPLCRDALAFTSS